MTNGTSQGLFIVIAIVIFGIFVGLSQTLFGKQLTNDLVNLFEQATEQAYFDKNKDYNVEGVTPSAETDFIFDGVNKIIGYKGSSTEVVIPNEIDNKKVTTISGDAFNNKGITKLIMPNSLTTIEDGSIVIEPQEVASTYNFRASDENISRVVGAFANNTIEEISFSANLKYIGSFAFFSGELKDVILPEGLKSIGESAFENNNLTDINIPSTVEHIGNSSFKDNELSDVSYNSGSQIASIGSNVFSGNNIDFLKLPSSVSVIPDNAYSNSGLKEVIIPKGTTSIGKNAFSNNNLTNVVIPEGVKEIEEGAFKENEIDNLELPSGLERIGDYAFYKNKLPVIDLPNSLLSIGKYAFYSNELSFVEIPNKLSVIREWTFAYNKLNTKPNIPSNVEKEEENAFYGNLFSVKKPYDTDVIVTNASNFTFNKATKTITNYIGTQTNIVIPYEIDGVTVEHIGAYAFNTSTTTGNKIKVTPKSVVIPNTVKTIGDFAFASPDDSTSLSSLTLGSSVESIGKYAFREHNLSSLTIPNSVKTIGEYAFYDHAGGTLGDKTLKTLVLGTSVENIGISAFRSSSLTQLNIPKSVKNIGANAFSYSEIKTVTLADANNSPIPKNTTSIFGTDITTTYAQPFVFNKETGTITDYWNYNKEIIIPSIIDGVTVEHIGAYAFNTTSSGNKIKVTPTKVVIPNTVKTIGDFAFASPDDSTSLSSLTLGSSVESIGKYAFREHNLSSLTIPNSVKTIGEYAFYDHAGQTLGDKTLKTLVLGTSVENIGISAFRSSSLTQLNIPKSVKNIGANAFSYSEIKTVTLADANNSPIPKNTASIFGTDITTTYAQPFVFNKETGTITDYWNYNKEIIIPSIIDGVTVEHIGAYAFNTASSGNKIKVTPTKVVIPNTVKTIGDFAFASPNDSTSLSSLTLGSSVESIGKYAFREHNLSSLTIPNSVKTIGDYAFYDYAGGALGDNTLKSVNIYNPSIKLGLNVFTGVTPTYIR